MNLPSFDERERVRTMPREELRALQRERVRALLATILPANRFYAARFGGVAPAIDSDAAWQSIPYTTKEELIGGGSDADLAANLTWPIEQYVRYHRTSGTRGRPMVVLDTADDWRGWTAAWQYVLDGAEVTPRDHVLLAFSFGPFIGFWSAFDAVAARGAMVIPSGGLSSLARLDLIRSARATVLFSTPSYVLHLAHLAAEQGIEPGALGLRRIIVAGEPGGSVPSVRRQIESHWQARLIDHAGASEVGPWGFADSEQRGLLVNEYDFLPEFRSLATDRPAEEGELSELVLTTLFRPGCPVIRYRTGDLVRPVWSHGDRCRFVLLEGGILGRVDEMIVVRGVNIFPSSIEEIVREFPEVSEFRITAFREGNLDQLSLEVEDRLDSPQRIAERLHSRLGLKIEVAALPAGTLPRSEGKARRFVDQRPPVR